MKELIQLYNQFLKDMYSLLSNQNAERASEAKNENQITSLYDVEKDGLIIDFTIQPYKSSSINEIQSFIKKYSLKIPNDIQQFWATMTTELRIYIKREKGTLNLDHISHGGIDDFYNILYLERDINDFREIAEIVEFDPDYTIHKEGFPLTYEEPQLAYSPGDGKIYFVIYDGSTPEFPIADSFEEFFKHYLASGCFQSSAFKPYWELVKNIVPIKIPISENKWLQFYKQVYSHTTDIE